MQGMDVSKAQHHNQYSCLIIQFVNASLTCALVRSCGLCPHAKFQRLYLSSAVKQRSHLLLVQLHGPLSAKFTDVNFIQDGLLSCRHSFLPLLYFEYAQYKCGGKNNV